MNIIIESIYYTTYPSVGNNATLNDLWRPGIPSDPWQASVSSSSVSESSFDGIEVREDLREPLLEDPDPESEDPGLVRGQLWRELSMSATTSSRSFITTLSGVLVS